MTEASTCCPHNFKQLGEESVMRSAWVNKSLRRFPLLRPGTSTSSPILGIALVARGGLTFRNLFSCIQKRPAPSPLLSGLLPTIDVCSGGRRATMLGSVRYVTCNMHRRTGGLVQFALTTRTRFSSTGVQPTAVPPGPISVLGTRSCSFSTSANGASKKLEILDGSQVAEADVAEVMEPTKEEPRHAHIELPSITDVGGFLPHCAMPLHPYLPSRVHAFSRRLLLSPLP